MKSTIKPHRGHSTLTTGVGALFLALATVHFVSAQTNTGSVPKVNETTTNGINAAASIGATATDNSAYGYLALRLTTTGARNTALGSQALGSNTTGTNNTATGYFALRNNATGVSNMACGDRALYSNVDGYQNVGVGDLTLYSNISGYHNTATGYGALFTNTGIGNTADGYQALYHNTTGNNNTASGWQALYSNTFGYGNTASGFKALNLNTTGQSNVASGYLALAFNTTGSDNTASGFSALFSNTTGSHNTVSGDSALAFNTTGWFNTATGTGALQFNTTGSNNIAIGNTAGQLLTTGSNNIDIGNRGVGAESNAIRIGVQGTQTATFIAGIRGATVAGGVAVQADANGRLGTIASSRCFKKDIAGMDGASDALLSLRPVTFRYKTDIDPKGVPQFGLIAEEVEKVAPELVARDDKGVVYTVRYEAVNAMLLNEFLKEHRRVDAEVKTNAEQAKTIAAQAQAIAEQQEQIRTLVSGLAGVSERIEKMAQRMGETKAPAVQNALHQAPASY